MYFSSVSTLFFTEDLPATINSTQELSSLCSERLPDLPTSTVTTVSRGGGGGGEGVAYSYCMISSARGSFRSRSVIVTEEGELSLTLSIPTLTLLMPTLTLSIPTLTLTTPIEP